MYIHIYMYIHTFEYIHIYREREERERERARESERERERARERERESGIEREREIQTDCLHTYGLKNRWECLLKAQKPAAITSRTKMRHLRRIQGSNSHIDVGSWAPDSCKGVCGPSDPIIYDATLKEHKGASSRSCFS